MAYTDSIEEADKVLLKWLTVIDEFCHCYTRLNQLIRRANPSSSWGDAQQTGQLHKLLQLREQVGETMATLLRDMSPLLPYPSSIRPLYTKLQVHASLLDDLNQTIDKELAFTGPTAYA